MVTLEGDTSTWALDEYHVIQRQRFGFRTLILGDPCLWVIVCEYCQTRWNYKTRRGSGAYKATQDDWE